MGDIERARKGQEIRGHQDVYWYPEDSELLATWQCEYEGIGGGNNHYLGRLYRTKLGAYILTRQQRNWWCWWGDEWASHILDALEAVGKLEGAKRGNGLDSNLELTSVGKEFYDECETDRLRNLREV